MQSDIAIMTHNIYFQALAAIGGIISIVVGGGLLSFCFWATFCVSGSLVLLNVLNVYQALHTKFNFLAKVVITLQNIIVMF